MSSNSECVKVAIRVRPLSTKEISENQTSIIEVDRDSTPNQLYVRSTDSALRPLLKSYAFDHVFDESNSQLDVYRECASPIIESVLQGYNGTLFAYGQTGTGKTYTMEGKISDDEHKGIIPRTFTQIIDFVSNASENVEFLVRISFLEIYQDEVYDLLSKNTRQKMEVKEGSNGFYVKNLTMYSVKTTKDMFKVLKKGQKTRAVGATAMNPGSSRSHCILTIIVESSRKGEDGQDHYIMGKLNLVDLAGSERQKKTQAKGDRLDEAKFINLSLSALGNVIKSLVNPKSTHIPFRDSKLTRLLSDSLGGNTKTVMIANIGPSGSNMDETMSTLRYANRAKNIKNKPRINEDPKDAMIRKMKEELQNLQRQLNGDAAGNPASKSKKVSEKKVIKKVEVWKGVSKEEVERLKLKAVDAKNKLKELHKKDEEKYEMARIEAEKAAKTAEENLRIAQEKLDKEHDELRKLEQQLESKTTQLIHGGSKLNEARVKERELLETHRKLQESEQKQEHFVKELDSIMADEQNFDQQFGAIQEEISDTTLKLKTLWKKYQSKVAELKDLEDENELEEKELSENIKTLTRQFQLKSLILEYFIPSKWLEFIEEHSQFDADIDQWRIPALEYSGNNMAPQRAMMHGDELDEEEMTYAAVDNEEMVNAVTERPLTHRRMQQIWKRAKALSGDESVLQNVDGLGYEELMMMKHAVELESDVVSSMMAPEVQEAVYFAMNTNMDPNQNGEKVYLTYGVDMDTLKKRGKTNRVK